MGRSRFYNGRVSFCGTPIITSDCPNGPKEFIGKNDKVVLFISQNDVNSFQNELDNFLNISKELFKKNKAKKRSRLFTGYNNYKKLSYLLKLVYIFSLILIKNENLMSNLEERHKTKFLRIIEKEINNLDKPNYS